MKILLMMGDEKIKKIIKKFVEHRISRVRPRSASLAHATDYDIIQSSAVRNDEVTTSL